jgi:hypothetical protein
MVAARGVLSTCVRHTDDAFFSGGRPMFTGVSLTHVLVLVLNVVVIGAVSVAVIRITLGPLSAKLDRVIALLEARGRASGA